MSSLLITSDNHLSSPEVKDILVQIFCAIRVTFRNTFRLYIRAVVICTILRKFCYQAFPLKLCVFVTCGEKF